MKTKLKAKEQAADLAVVSSSISKGEVIIHEEGIPNDIAGNNPVEPKGQNWLTLRVGVLMVICVIGAAFALGVGLRVSSGVVSGLAIAGTGLSVDVFGLLVRQIARKL